MNQIKQLEQDVKETVEPSPVEQEETPEVIDKLEEAIKIEDQRASAASESEKSAERQYVEQPNNDELELKSPLIDALKEVKERQSSPKSSAKRREERVFDYKEKGNAADVNTDTVPDS